MMNATELFTLDDDLSEKEKNKFELVRRGFGWHGETLIPDSIYPFNDTPDVYGLPWNSAKSAPIQMVYVPGGKTICDACGDTGMPGYGSFGGESRYQPCGKCFRTGKMNIKPFYISRFPITVAQFCVFLNSHTEVCGWKRPEHGWKPDLGLDYCPVTDTSYLEAVAFAVWANARIPSPAEWRWAALGEEPHCDFCRSRSRSELLCVCACIKCHKRYPWGNLGADSFIAVYANLKLYKFREQSHPVLAHVHQCGNIKYVEQFSDSVIECGRHGGTSISWPLGPARPDGESWCGAQDMAGNVWEWVGPGKAMGGSFRTSSLSCFDEYNLSDACRKPADVEDEDGDDIGFRIVVSATDEGAS